MKIRISKRMAATVSLFVALASHSSSCIGLAADGKATIYSNRFAGKKTASGKTYKPHEMTAASNKLPLGSTVKVKNKKTGKNTTVKITDRMSKKSSAVVDLSKGAANKIGVKGTAPVQANVVRSKP
jgi:rare lipoprotein A